MLREDFAKRLNVRAFGSSVPTTKKGIRASRGARLACVEIEIALNAFSRDFPTSNSP
jgi:hypothetical protein